MGNPSAKRRRPEEGYRKPAKKIRKFKKQKNYHSSSESDDDEVEEQVTFNPVSMEDSDIEDEGVPVAEPTISSALKPAPKQAAAPQTKNVKHTASLPRKKEKDAVIADVGGDEDEEDDEAGDDDVDVKDVEEEDDDDEEEDDEDEDDIVENLDDLEVIDDDDELGIADDDEFGDSDSSDTRTATKKRKRNDPTAFANSMSKILSSKLSTSKRSDPVLSRSLDAATASKELIDARLEAKARRQLHAEKRQAMEKGRVKDVLGLETTNVSTANIQEQERRLKKTAQRGVVKLFNAVRAAQVKGEQARAEARKEGIVGMGQREERASEMSKKGFLDLLAQGGKKTPAVN